MGIPRMAFVPTAAYPERATTICQRAPPNWKHFVSLITKIDPPAPALKFNCLCLRLFAYFLLLGLEWALLCSSFIYVHVDSHWKKLFHFQSRRPIRFNEILPHDMNMMWCSCSSRIVASWGYAFIKQAWFVVDENMISNGCLFEVFHNHYTFLYN